MYVTPKSPKGWHKNAISLFVPVKFNFSRKKVYYKVSLCENFQQQSCSYIISLSNGQDLERQHDPYFALFYGRRPHLPEIGVESDRKRRFPKFLSRNSWHGYFLRQKFSPKNLVFLAIYHLWRYSKGITPSEGVKMTNSRLRGWIRKECCCFLTVYGGVALAWLKPRPCLHWRWTIIRNHVGSGTGKAERATPTV